MKRFILALLLGAFVLPLGNVSASTLTVVVEGVVTSVDVYLQGDFSIGSSMRLSYVFETQTLDSYVTDETAGLYLGAIQSANFEIGNYGLLITGGGNIFTRDGKFSQDLYAVELGRYPFIYDRPTANFLGDTVQDLFPYYAGISLNDWDEMAFTSDALPMAWPSLSVFEVNEITLGFANQLRSGVAYGVQRVEGVITSISVVPIPAAVWLFGSALGLLGWMRRMA